MREVNLLPTSYQKKERNSVIIKSVFLMIVLLVLFLGSLYVAISWGILHLETVLGYRAASQVNLEMKELKGQLIALDNQMKDFYVRKQLVVEGYMTSAALINLLERAGDFTSDRVWLTELECHAFQKQCSLKGKAFNTRLVSEFMLDLKKLSFFESVDLVSMGKEESQNIKEGIDFALRCHMK